MFLLPVHVVAGMPVQRNRLEPLIVVSLLADSSVNIVVKPWVAVADFGVAASEINLAILATFRDAGIVIPFPQREVRMVAAA